MKVSKIIVSRKDHERGLSLLAFLFVLAVVLGGIFAYIRWCGMNAEGREDEAAERLNDATK